MAVVAVALVVPGSYIPIPGIVVGRKGAWSLGLELEHVGSNTMVDGSVVNVLTTVNITALLPSSLSRKKWVQF